MFSISGTCSSRALAALLVLLILATGGCAGSAEESESERRLEDQRAFTAGEYARILAELEENLADDACRQRSASIMRAVADGLAAHHDAIIHHLASTAPTASTPPGTRPFGESLLKPDEVPAGQGTYRPGDPEAVERWAIYSWARAGDLLAKARKTARDKDWSDLWVYAKRLTEHELWRGRQSVRLLPRDELDVLEELTAEARACDADAQCTTLARLTARERAFLRGRPRLAALVAALDKKAPRAVARDHIHELYIGLDDVLSFHSDRPTSAVTTRGQTLVIAVDPGPYRGVCTDIGDIVSEFWSAPNMPVEVNCSPWPTERAAAFRLTFVPDSAVSFVDRRNQIVGFTRILQPRVIAHEFGHVMGLMDRYFHSFDEKQCTYVIEVDSSDLMSGHDSGAPTDSARRFLRTTYFDEPSYTPQPQAAADPRPF